MALIVHTDKHTPDPDVPARTPEVAVGKGDESPMEELGGNTGVVTVGKEDELPTEEPGENTGVVTVDKEDESPMEELGENTVEDTCDEILAGAALSDFQLDEANLQDLDDTLATAMREAGLLAAHEVAAWDSAYVPNASSASTQTEGGEGLQLQMQF